MRSWDRELVNAFRLQQELESLRRIGEHRLKNQPTQLGESGWVGRTGMEWKLATRNVVTRVK